VLVTGGTGFLGRETVSQLLAGGADVHVLARRESLRGPLAALPITWHEGDLRDAPSIERAVSAVAAAGAEARLPARVIHAAALISYRTKDRELSRQINVEGTRSMVEAAIRSGISRFLHVSSVVTVGHCVGPDPIDERAEFNLGHLGVAYVDTKRAAEELTLEASATLSIVVVNPGAIFGPIERSSNTVRLIRRTAERRLPPFVPPGSVGVLGVQDAARGTILAMEHGRSGERYLLVEASLSIADLYARIARAVGVPPVERVLPSGAWRALTAVSAVWDAMFPIRLTPPQALRMLGQDLRFDARKARRDLGWDPAPFEAVLSSTVAHVRANEGKFAAE
jgi:nucleoside-diphosphate-sugar epimerase